MKAIVKIFWHFVMGFPQTKCKRHSVNCAAQAIVPLNSLFFLEFIVCFLYQHVYTTSGFVPEMLKGTDT